MTSPYDEHSMSTTNLNRPQTMKIYKLNKNSTLQHNNVTIENNNLGIKSLTSSQKKINSNENIMNKNK